MRRLLIYSQDGMGLGHLRRAFNVAGEVVAREPGCAVLVLGDSPAIPFFPPLPGVDYVKLPTVVKSGSASWRAAALPLDVEETIELRARLLVETFAAFRPDTVLVDHMPVGALGELKPLLARVSTLAHPPRLVLGLRDVLDAPDAIRRAWSDVGAYEQLERYDVVLVYGCREVYDTAAAYGLTPHVRRLVYCHYVTDRARPNGREPEAGERLVVVTGGGGADAFPLAAAFLRALPAVLSETTVRALVLCGPNMPPAQRRALADLAARRPAEVGTGFEDAAACFSRAAAVVTMAGYNSLCEVLRRRRRALVVPRAGPSAEQRLRSRLFAERRLVRALPPEEVTPARLAREVLAVLADERLPDPGLVPPLDGAERAAAVLLEEHR